MMRRPPKSTLLPHTTHFQSAKKKKKPEKKKKPKKTAPKPGAKIKKTGRAHVLTSVTRQNRIAPSASKNKRPNRMPSSSLTTKHNENVAGYSKHNNNRKIIDNK